MKTRNLNSEVKKVLEPFCVDYTGFADLKKYQKELEEVGGVVVKGYESGISIGISIPDSIVDHLPHRDDINVACEYRTHGYDLINQRLNLCASVLASCLNKMGHRTLPLSAADWTSIPKGTATISHKMIAHIAGLGWIGKSCLLITPEHGPRVRWISLLTNAPLETVDNPIEQRCGDCTECTSICPTRAIKGQSYKMGEPRDMRLDYDKCSGYLDELKATVKYPVCGMCLYICPKGRR